MTGLVWIVASAATTERWGHAVRAAFGSALPLPWSEIRAVGDTLAARQALERVRPDLVLLTSPNALRTLSEGVGKGFDAACVGNLTASLALAAGFTVRHVGRGTGADLARELVAAGPPGLVVFLRGETVRPEATNVLEQAGWRVEEHAVYEARPRAAFDADVAAAPEPSAFVVGSPAAARALEGALNTAGREALRERPAVAIGATTATDLAARGFRHVLACETPGLGGILAVLRDLLP